MDIQFLGIGSAINSSNNYCSFLIGNSVLIDAAPSVSVQLLKNEIPLSELDSIIITHLHGDHYFGLPFLLIEYLFHKRDKPLKIYGPVELEERTNELLKLAYADTPPKELIENSKPEFHIIYSGSTIEMGNGYKFKFVKVKHGQTETYGFHFEFSGTAGFYSADTEYVTEIDNIISDVDFCILDGTTYNFSIPGHMSYMEIKEIVSKYPDLITLIVHRSRYEVAENEKLNNILLPNDNDFFSIWKEKKQIQYSLNGTKKL